MPLVVCWLVCHAISQDRALTMRFLQQFNVNSMRVFVWTLAYIYACEPVCAVCMWWHLACMWLCTCHVSHEMYERDKKRRELNWREKKTEYIVGSRTLYAKAWNIIRCESLWPRATLPLFRSFDSYTFARPGRSNEPKHNFFFTRCICMQKCFLYSLSQRFFFFFLLRRSCTSNTHTLKLSSIACENSISLCLWLFFLLFEYDHYSAYVMYVCARIIIINVDWVLFFSSSSNNVFQPLFI